MEAYAVVAPFDPDFADHDWAVTNVKNAGRKSDFSTVWPNRDDHDLCLDDYDSAVYLYGGRKSLYEALEPFDDARIRNFVHRHRDDPIHAYRAVLKVGGGKTKQIIMLAVANRQRDQDLAALRDTDLEASDAYFNCYVSEFRKKMKAKWPDLPDD